MGKTAEADVAYIGTGDTLRQAGHRMSELGVAVLPVCGEDGRHAGIVTRDMVVESIAAGGDPKTVTVGEVASHAQVPSRPARWQGIGLRIGELADAVRDAAGVVSRLGAAAAMPGTSARPTAQAAQRYGCRAA